jgi:transcriptional regulator with GAF, ATPase, and Fis domain
MQSQQTVRLLGRSDAVRTVLEDIGYASATDAKVLITGESGVGKEIAAHLVHGGSRRATRPFVTLNCAGVPDSLLESELFGHTRGSFTGAVRDRGGLLEMANGGTLFMDEVGEMSLRMQALLLRFLETGEIQKVGSDGRNAIVNVRLITATNRDLMQQVRAGAFRADLYYRLNVIHVAIPPLRERREDVPILAEAFLARFAADYQAPPLVLSPEALQRLVDYDWPGNVRELRNVIERVIVRVRDRAVLPRDLPAEVDGPVAVRPAAAPVASRSDALYDRLVYGQEPFWSAVYEPFMERDLTRQEVRALVVRGLHETRGNYRMLVRLFNMDAKDYKRFLNVLHKHGCHIPVASFRDGTIRRPLPVPVSPSFETTRFA